MVLKRNIALFVALITMCLGLTAAVLFSTTKTAVIPVEATQEPEITSVAPFGASSGLITTPSHYSLDDNGLLVPYDYTYNDTFIWGIAKSGVLITFRYVSSKIFTDTPYVYNTPSYLYTQIMMNVLLKQDSSPGMLFEIEGFNGVEGGQFNFAIFDDLTYMGIGIFNYHDMTDFVDYSVTSVIFFTKYVEYPIPYYNFLGSYVLELYYMRADAFNFTYPYFFDNVMTGHFANRYDGAKFGPDEVISVINNSDIPILPVNDPLKFVAFRRAIYGDNYDTYFNWYAQKDTTWFYAEYSGPPLKLNVYNTVVGLYEVVEVPFITIWDFLDSVGFPLPFRSILSRFNMGYFFMPLVRYNVTDDNVYVWNYPYWTYYRWELNAPRDSSGIVHAVNFRAVVNILYNVFGLTPVAGFQHYINYVYKPLSWIVVESTSRAPTISVFAKYDQILDEGYFEVNFTTFFANGGERLPTNFDNKDGTPNDDFFETKLSYELAHKEKRIYRFFDVEDGKNFVKVYPEWAGVSQDLADKNPSSGCGDINVLGTDYGCGSGTLFAGLLGTILTVLLLVGGAVLAVWLIFFVIRMVINFVRKTKK